MKCKAPKICSQTLLGLKEICNHFMKLYLKLCSYKIGKLCRQGVGREGKLCFNVTKGVYFLNGIISRFLKVNCHGIFE